MVDVGCKIYIDESDIGKCNNLIINKAIKIFKEDLGVIVYPDDCEIIYDYLDEKVTYNKKFDSYNGLGDCYYKGEHIGIMGWGIKRVETKIAVKVIGKGVKETKVEAKFI